MGLIMIVAIPAMTKMIHNNNNQEYENYYTLVEEAALTYASTLEDDLGSSKYSGCAKVELDDLVDGGYIKTLNNAKGTCTTGSNGIVIRNDKGSITVKFKLECTKDGDNVYINGIDDSGACDPYTIEEEKNLKVALDESGITTKSEGNDEYVIGSNPSNYIWYSGKLWRIISYNTSTEIVKAVTLNSMTSIYYNSLNTSNYIGSDVETWLNNDFLNSLKDSQSFIISNNWDATADTTPNDKPLSSDSTKIKKAKVGLITTYEYGLIKDWYGGQKSWILSEGSGNNSVYSSPSGIATAPSTTIYGVRPVVTFSSNVLVHDGSGTASDPYIIDNTTNAVGKNGENINTRFSGEYVKIGSNKYRIVTSDGETTKLIGTTSIGINAYDSARSHFDYASSTLRRNLEETTTLLTTEKTLFTNGDFCLDTINSANITYRSSRCLTPERVNNVIKIGLPKIGDLFTTNIPNVTGEYWTINPNTEVDGNGTHYDSTINTITPEGSTSSDTITKTKDTVIVFYLDSSVKITGGNGTVNNPYTLAK